MQRALIQYRNPKNYYLVREALLQAHREDLIGSGPKCLIRAIPPRAGGQQIKKPLPANPKARTAGKGKPPKPAGKSKSPVKAAKPAPKGGKARGGRR